VATNLGALSPQDLERERKAFVSAHCSDTTRLDVQDWVGRVFGMMVKQSAEQHSVSSTKERRRRARSSGGTSDSGTSGTTLRAAGARSLASQDQRAPSRAASMVSAESLVVNTGQGTEALSNQERLRAYFSGELPELTAHVERYIDSRCEDALKRIDKDLRDDFLRNTTRRMVFDSRGNYLRWQNTRRSVIQRVLEAEMPRWIWDALKSWEEPVASHQARAKEVSDTDVIWDYLSKRAAHIDSSQLVTEIPIFKPLMASYSLPHMWRDKYS